MELFQPVARMMRQFAGFGRQGILTLLFFVGPIGLSAKETVLKVACVGNWINEGSALRRKALESSPEQLAKILGVRLEGVIRSYGRSRLCIFFLTRSCRVRCDQSWRWDGAWEG